jgi:hypothetical protein
MSAAARERISLAQKARWAKRNSRFGRVCETQAICLSSIEKENGGRATRKMGEIQSEKSGLELKGMSIHVPVV